MEIYVDELPKSCLDCWNVNCRTGCKKNCYEHIIKKEYIKKRPADCHLRSLSDRLAEERKKVVQEIRDIARKIARPTTEYDDKTFDYDIDAIEFDNLLLWFQNGKQDFVKTYLDQIERGKDAI